MGYRKLNEEVYYSETSSFAVSEKDISFLKQCSFETTRRRSRLCTHGSHEDLLHEMFIVHHSEAYVPPHKHFHKNESFHIIEGSVDVVLFDDDGVITSVIAMGDYKTGKPFYARIEMSCYHTLIIRSDILVFHEITTGPFRKKDTILAPWAPEETDAESVDLYKRQLRQEIIQKR